MGHHALTAVGRDQPGIVAALTGALVDLGCNLEDSTMSILRGNFAVLLVLAGPDALGAEAVEQALVPVADRLDLTVTVRPMHLEADEVVGEDGSAGGAPSSSDPGQMYTFSVHGADRPGIVHRAAEALATSGANIVDLATRLVGTATDPVYVLTLTVAYPPEADAEGAATAVQQSVEAFGVQCHAQRVEIDIL